MDRPTEDELTYQRETETENGTERDREGQLVNGRETQ